MTDHDRPIVDVLADAEAAGVTVSGHVPGVGLIYGFARGAEQSPFAHQAVEALDAREAEVVDAWVAYVADRWASGHPSGHHPDHPDDRAS